MRVECSTLSMSDWGRHSEDPLRYVGVIWFVLHVFPIPSIRFIQWNVWCVALVSIGVKHLGKSDWKSGLCWFGYGCRKCMFCSFLNWIHRSSQLCSLLSVEWVVHVINTSHCDVCSLILIKPRLVSKMGQNLAATQNWTHMVFVTHSSSGVQLQVMVYVKLILEWAKVWLVG